MDPEEFVVLGAGVVGLTTASELASTFPSAKVTVVAKHLPGDRSIEYTSPWAGANWSSVAKDGARLEEYDRIAFVRFLEIARLFPDSGVQEMPIRRIFDAPDTQDIDEAKKKHMNLWFKDLVGGIREVPKVELPRGGSWGYEHNTVIINTAAYLSWLQTRLAQRGVRFQRLPVTHIKELSDLYPSATAIFNCSGLGARKLGGVEDQNVYPTKGQTLLVADPIKPMTKMYVHASSALSNEFTHVFPRPLGGGIIMGGIRSENDWSPEPDAALAERIKRRACDLCPELGSPEDLKVISHNVGLRPSRKGNTRVEAEEKFGRLIIHNYGASGAGYQSSWGSACHAVDLLRKRLGKPRQFKL